MALGSGCYFEDDPDYAGIDAISWWRGLVMLHDVKEGCFNPEFIGMDKIKSIYGEKEISPLISITRTEPQSLKSDRKKLKNPFDLGEWLEE